MSDLTQDETNRESNRLERAGPTDLEDFWAYWMQFVSKAEADADVEELIRLAEQDEADRYIERMEENLRWSAENEPTFGGGKGWDDLDQGCM